MKRFLIIIIGAILIGGLGLYFMIEGLPMELEETAYKLSVQRTDLSQVQNLQNLTTLNVFDHDEITRLMHDGELVWKMVQESHYFNMSESDIEGKVEEFYKEVNPLVEGQAGKLVDMQADHRVEGDTLILSLTTDLKRVNRGFAPEDFQFGFGSVTSVLNSKGAVSLELYEKALQFADYQLITE